MKWNYPTVSRTEIEKEAGKLGLNPILYQFLKNRGITEEDEIDQFFDGSFRQCHRPTLMIDAEKAVMLLHKAIENKELIVVYSDYDCDGISSAVVGVKLLRKLGANVEFFTNNRFEHGYGMCVKGVDDLLEMYPKVSLILTTDNGIMAHEGVQYAKDKGITVVVTDHHEPGDTLPNADALVNPKRKDCLYPFKGLCGAGVIFKLMLLLYDKMGRRYSDCYEVLDIVALATVGDIVPLVDENRILVKAGLRDIEKEKRTVFRLLREMTKQTEITAHYTLGFVYVPIMNAIGRLHGDPRKAIELFFEEDEDVMREIITELISINEQRKTMTEEQCQWAVDKIESAPLPQVIVLYNEDFHEGIVGLIAGRIKERYNRPTFVFTKFEGGIKGSGRSIDDFHLKESMDVIRSTVPSLKGGGHAKACGCHLAEADLEAFTHEMNALANATLTEDSFIPKVDVDFVCKLSDLTTDLIYKLKTLEPFGEGNPKPSLAIDGVDVDKVFLMGENKDHIKFASGSTSIIMWRGAEHYDNIGSPTTIRAIGLPSINVWQGRTSVQFIVNNNCLLPAGE